ncbi:transposase tan1 [Pyrenophora tritici-repentis]|nr:transposase tan1 [Pyrenophora tritici-repentis]
MDNREVAIQNALHNLRAGVFKSQRQAARAWGVPRSTLQHRLAGRLPNAIAHSDQQRLTPEQDEFLVEWVLDEDLRAQPPTHLRIREMAIRIFYMNGDNAPLGQHWVANFLRRNPRVHSIVGRKIEAARAEAANPDSIREFLELYEATQRRLSVQLRDTYNIDETGVALGTRPMTPPRPVQPDYRDGRNHNTKAVSGPIQAR